MIEFLGKLITIHEQILTFICHSSANQDL